MLIEFFLFPNSLPYSCSSQWLSLDFLDISEPSILFFYWKSIWIQVLHVLLFKIPVIWQFPFILAIWECEIMWIVILPNIFQQMDIARVKGFILVYFPWTRSILLSAALLHHRLALAPTLPEPGLSQGGPAATRAQSSPKVRRPRAGRRAVKGLGWRSLKLLSPQHPQVAARFGNPSIRVIHSFIHSTKHLWSTSSMN